MWVGFSRVGAEREEESAEKHLRQAGCWEEVDEPVRRERVRDRGARKQREKRRTCIPAALAGERGRR